MKEIAEADSVKVGITETECEIKMGSNTEVPSLKLLGATRSQAFQSHPS